MSPLSQPSGLDSKLSMEDHSHSYPMWLPVIETGAIASKLGDFYEFVWRSAPAVSCAINDQYSISRAWIYPIRTVGQNWVYSYVNRQPELITRFSRRYDYRRAQ